MIQEDAEFRFGLLFLIKNSTPIVSTLGARRFAGYLDLEKWGLVYSTEEKRARITEKGDRVIQELCKQFMELVESE